MVCSKVIGKKEATAQESGNENSATHLKIKKSDSTARGQ